MTDQPIYWVLLEYDSVVWYPTGWYTNKARAESALKRAKASFRNVNSPDPKILLDSLRIYPPPRQAT